MEDKLIVRSAEEAVDVAVNMPAVGCGICGATAQIPAAALEVSHWDELYEPDGAYSDRQREHDRVLTKWSQEHAGTHTDAEHEEFARKK